MLVSASLVVAFLLLSGEHAVSAETAAPSYAITNIKAYLYLNHKDALSRDISDEPKGSLWNTIIGAGVAGSPSESTVVVVEISGEPGRYLSGRKLEVVVTEIGKKVVTKLKRQSPIGGLSREGKFYAAFLVYETGCLPLEISAQLLGQPDPFSKHERINFECGE
jgi:hypothetical protein